ncbi:hypothetical protein HYC85_002975 [Camellia sinensis]|uniref:AAA+ ATPase domain-containing protein n=1 Tax=Camellia sinensis TaxID=4442 RepID=A0A7J7IB40_CAMSI|nr:hypothetical protein HYC85_002975 [Camellia sinensis]
MMMMGGSWAELGSRIAGLVFVWATIQQFFPNQLRIYFEKLIDRFLATFYPYIQITIHEYSDGRRNEVYTAIKTYLGAKSTVQARSLKADKVKNSKSIVISLDNSEEVTDEFNGVKLWWALKQTVRNATTFTLYQSDSEEERKYYKLTFHRRYRDIVTGAYLSHTLAMDPKKKEEIINDLIGFNKGKDYYAKVGKAWKRGYLLYGPPGTGKSTMIAAMANFMNYDVYDLELTSVNNNTNLRKLLIDTTSKSIIVIEDIDCSLDLTGKRKKKNEESEDENITI